MDIANKILMAFMTLIIGVIIIGTIASSSNNISDLKVITNETHALGAALSSNGIGTALVNTSYPIVITNYPTGWKSEDCQPSSIDIRNGTNSALLKDTNYVFWPANGTVYLKGATTNTTFFTANNNSYISYQYCGDDYVNSSFGRSALDLTLGMFAIGILSVSIGLFWSIGKDAGII